MPPRDRYSKQGRKSEPGGTEAEGTRGRLEGTLGPISEGPTPIGVPADYIAVGRRPPENLPPNAYAHGYSYTDPTRGPGRFEQRPTFMDGDQFVIASWSATRVAELQRQMIEAGVLTDDEVIRIGIADPATIRAYETLLAWANAAGYTDTGQALAAWQRSGKGAGFGGGGRQREPLIVQLPNPDDLRRVFRAATIDALGEAWSDGDIETMVNSYTDVVAGVQRQHYALGEEGGTITEPPTAEAFAESRVQAMDPTGVLAHDTLGRMNDFFAALGGVV